MHLLQPQAIGKQKCLKITLWLMTGHRAKINDVSYPPMPDISNMHPPSLPGLAIDIWGGTVCEETTSAFTLLLRQSDDELE